MPVFLAPDEREPWLDNSHPIASDDAIFRSELKTPLLLTPLDRAVSNARNKTSSVLVAAGKPIALSG
jgi:putative SOS response-associated peptidase YedK